MILFQVTVGLNAAQSDTGAIEALVDGIVGGQANVTAGANTLTFTLEWDEALDGDYPSALSFQFAGSGGNSLTFTSVSINGESVDLGTYLDRTTINSGAATSTVSIGNHLRYMFGRQEPDVGDPADIRVNPGNALNTDLARPGDTTANVTIVPNAPQAAPIQGSSGRDIIYGSDFADRINAGDGDDSVAGNNGGDTLFGGAGNDLIAGGAGDDSIFGGLGDDLLFGNAGNDLIQGQGGNNVLNGGGGADTLVGGANNDILHGGADNDILSGGAGNDAMYGDDGDDLLSGGTGTDTGSGGAGDDTLSGGNGNDTLYGDADDDMLSGGAGNDVLYGDDGTGTSADGADIVMGGDGTDIVRGGLGNDVLMGEAGNDTIMGQDGDDVLIGGAGADTMDGGAGADAIYGASIDTATATALVAQSGRPDVSFGMAGNSFYKVVPGSFNYATAAAAAAADTLNGVAGHLAVITTAAEQATVNELVAAAGGSGQFWAGASDAGFWGEGVWTWNYGPENTQQFSNNAGASVNGLFTYWQGGAPTNSSGAEDYLALNADNSGYWTANASTVTFGYIIEWDATSMSADAGTDIMPGGDGDDAIYGGAGGSTFDGGAGNDRLYGGTGNDTFKGGAGVDLFMGGGGTDTYDANTATESVVIANYLGVLLLGTNDGYGASGEVYNSISNITGGAFNDTIEGGSGNSVLIGGGGTDTLTYASATAGITVNLALTTAQATAGSGTDTVSGFENLTGSAYADTLTGDSGNNTIDGGAGNDVIEGGGGNDLLIGGVNTDTVTYANATGGVTVNLATTAAQNTGGAGMDTFSGFENLAGSAYADTLTGDTGDNVITGGAGADTLDGGAGNDTFNLADGDFAAGESITGGAGSADAIIVTSNGAAVDFTVGTLSGVETLTGSGGVEIVTMLATQYAGMFTAIDLAGGADYLQVVASGTMDISGASGATLTSVDNGALYGTAGNDTITLTGAQLNALMAGFFPVIDLGGGIDTINITSNSTRLNTVGTSGWNLISNVEAISAATATGAVTFSMAAQTEAFILTGSAYNDTITGGAGADTISGGDGDDTLASGSGAAIINGGNGNDLITGGGGVDTIDGGAGNDTFNLASGDFAAGDSITGGTGTADKIVLTTSATTVDFTTGTLASVETLTGSAGNDVVTVAASSAAGMFATIDLGSGTADVLNVAGTSNISAATLATISNVETGNITGTSGNDSFTLTGAQLNALIIGSGTINMGGGTADTISLSSTSTDLNTLGSTDASIQNLEVISGASAASITINMSAQTEGFTIFGTAGADTLIGGAGNDVIHPGGTAGTGYFDSLDGGAGVDTIDFSDITPTGGHSVYVAWFGITYVFDDGTGSDLYALSNFENVTGSSANDILDLARDTVDSVVIGGLGDDTLAGGGGNNTLDGGSGNDTASYGNTLGVTTGIVANLALTAGQVTNNGAAGGGGVDTLIGIEHLYGSAYNDTITGSSGTDTLSGAAGNDTIDGGNGDDTVDGGTGNDILTGGTGTDTVSFGGATAAVTFSLSTTTAQNTGGGGTDTVSGFENVIGSGFGDILTGDSTANTISGGGGNDTLTGGAGNDTLDGGAGTADIVSYSTSTAAVTANLATGTASDGLGGADTLIAIDRVTGSSFADVLTGDAADNVITGGAGADTISGGDGNDVLFGQGGGDTIDGGAGNDTIDGGAGVDVLIGGTGTDTVSYATAAAGVIVDLASGVAVGTSTIHSLATFENITGSGFADTLTGDGGANTIDGGAGNDTIEGGAGNDMMIGGTGTDTVSYAGATAGVTMNLATTTAQATGGSGSDTVSGFENLTGSGSADTLTGDSGPNVIDGGAGNDQIHGGGGNDVLMGGAGNDVIYSDSTTTKTVTDVLNANAGLYYSSQTGNFYKYLNSGISGYAAAHNEAAAAILSGISGTAGDGHVLTINSQSEFDLVRNTIDISAGTWMGIGDQAAVNTYLGAGGAEGTWKYLEGPEAGFTFYAGSAGVSGFFINTSNFTGAMNTAANDYAMMRGTDVWTDQDGSESNHRVIEWEGQRVFDANSGATIDTVTLYGGAGSDILYGGAGHDVFLLMSGDTAGGAIDEIGGLGGDTTFNASFDQLDLAGLLTGYTAGTSNPNDFVQFTTSGSDTLVKIDANGTTGGSSYTQIATIKGLTGIDVDDWALHNILHLG